MSVKAHFLIVLNDERVVEIAEGVNEIGRKGGAIALGDSSVSRKHASIMLKDDIVWIENHSERNPVRIGKLQVLEPRRLRDGDRLIFGDVMGVYHAPHQPRLKHPRRTLGETAIIGIGALAAVVAVVVIGMWFASLGNEGDEGGGVVSSEPVSSEPVSSEPVSSPSSSPVSVASASSSPASASPSSAPASSVSPLAAEEAKLRLEIEEAALLVDAGDPKGGDMLFAITAKLKRLEEQGVDIGKLRQRVVELLERLSK